MVLKHNSLNERVYQVIKEKIIALEFPSGSRLQEEQLVKLLGTSKTPIKIALAKLEQDGLVESTAWRGTYVIQLTTEMMNEIYSLREVLEGFAARLSTLNLSVSDLENMKDNLSKFDPSSNNLSLKRYLELDSWFHLTIIRGAKNRYLEESLRLLYDKINMFKLRAAAVRQNSGEPYREHLKILEAMEAREQRLAEDAMRFHIRQVMKVLQENFRHLTNFEDLHVKEELKDADESIDI